jgi:hypothetical protein
MPEKANSVMLVAPTVTSPAAAAAASDGEFAIGGYNRSATTTVTATGLINNGSLTLGGSYSSNSALAEILVNGAARTTGSITMGARTKIDVEGSFTQAGGSTVVGSGAEIDVGGAFTQAGGSTSVAGSLVASTINVKDGLLDFESAIASGDGVPTIKVGAQGDLEFDASVDKTHQVRFTSPGGMLALGDPGEFDGTINGFSHVDVIDLLGQGVMGLAYSGKGASGILTVAGSGGTIAELDLAGHYTTSSFAFAPDGHGGTDILHA